MNCIPVDTVYAIGVLAGIVSALIVLFAFWED